MANGLRMFTNTTTMDNNENEKTFYCDWESSTQIMVQYKYKIVVSVYFQ